VGTLIVRLDLSVFAKYFPHSPAAKGPFSGKGWTPYSGIAIVAGLADGMKSHLGPLARASGAVAAAAMPNLRLPDFSNLGAVAAAAGGTSYGPTFNANFAVTAQPGMPLADQVFSAASRLRARHRGK